MSGNLDGILALSALHEEETSPLHEAKLASMLKGAFHHAVIGDGSRGYLIAFDQDADYDSVNFRWFQARFDRFVYVDRIVVAASERGKGAAKQFYLDLFAAARAAGHTRIVAEINVEPPNPGSLAFHAAIGFVELGQAELSREKVVSYQEYRL
jgi:uncharacterized protein